MSLIGSEVRFDHATYSNKVKKGFPNCTDFLIIPLLQESIFSCTTGVRFNSQIHIEQVDSLEVGTSDLDCMSLFFFPCKVNV